MLRNYLKITFRNLIKNKFYASLNILGLGVAIASCLFIAFYVLDEIDFDKFHKNATQAFRINTYWGDNPQSDIYATTPPPLHDVIQSEIPEIEQVARAFKWNDSTMRLPKDSTNEERIFRETNIYIVDPNFLEILDFNLIAGDASTAFQDLEAIVLTKETAIRYFGKKAVENGEVLGKNILFGGREAARHVTAIVDPPANTHFPFDMLVNLRWNYIRMFDNPNWAWNIVHTYVKIPSRIQRNPAQLAIVQSKLTDIAEQHGKPFMQSAERMKAGANFLFDYRLQRVTDIHLQSNFLREHTANGNTMVVYMLSIIAVLIILLACINFMNLSTAQASRRAKEVGVRKVLGSQKSQLVGQFLTEAILFSLLSGCFALGIVEAFRNPFNMISGKEIPGNWFMELELIGLFFIGLILVGLLAGSYPAFYLAKFRPVEIIKGKLVSRKGKADGFRNALVVFQFSISIGLIICTVLVDQQLQFMQEKNLGYDKENVLIIKNDKEIREKWEVFTQTLEQQPEVLKASFATGIPFQSFDNMRDFREEGADKGMGINWITIDENYVETIGLEMLEGRGFRRDMPLDKDGLVLNEAAVEVLGLDSPIGQRIIKNKGADDEQSLQVIGVVKDFYFESFYNDIKPLAMQLYRPHFVSDFIAVRLAPGPLNKSIAAIEHIWKQFEPGNPFTYSFLDHDFDALFRSEKRLGNVLTLFTSLAIIIACLGLLGLASFVAQQRTKEIGIRKVFGASTAQIVHLLSRDFTKLVFLSILIAVPLSYYTMVEWLASFAYRIEISPWVFVLSGGLALLIAWFTISFQSIKAALANPIQSIRYE